MLISYWHSKGTNMSEVLKTLVVIVNGICNVTVRWFRSIASMGSMRVDQDMHGLGIV